MATKKNKFKRFVSIPKSVYDTLIDAAQSQLQDLESGVADGVYEDNIVNSTQINALKNVLKTKPTEPSIYIYIEGGVMQGASANMEMDVEVFDKDNYDDSFEEDEENNYASNYFTSLEAWNKMIKDGLKDGSLITVF